MPKRVVIIGAGIVGLCTGYSLLRRGCDVTIVDRDGPNHEGCSFGNAGMVVPSHVIPLAAPGMVRMALKMMLRPRSPFFIRPRLSWDLIDWSWRFMRAANAGHVDRSAPVLRDLHLASRALYEQLAELPGADFGLTKLGLLMLCKSEHALHEEAALATRAKELGIPAEVLNCAQTAARDPNVKMDVAGSVYFPLDCHLRPDRLVVFLRKMLAEAGVKFVWNNPVTGWRREGNSISAAMTTQGDISADEYLICGGSWSPSLVHDLGLRLPMQAGKGYSLTLKNPRRLPRLCSILTEARVAVTPMGDTLRFGGTMEIAGLNQRISRGRVRGIIESIPQYFPEFTPDDFQDVPVWSGLRPCSPDGLPYIGRAGAYENLSIATGHAMMGISLGPISGELVAQMICREELAVDIGLLDPMRFARSKASWNQENKAQVLTGRSIDRPAAG
ncbi:MAG TPA: FAD-dependent oxidoreductase [Humisphaera sp.]|jgi:D-amino-acid dehydrogenase|nr:FAD-dependent oxidoreductase [Humisphaera sp.]